MKGISVPPTRHIDLLVDDADQCFLNQFGEYVKDLMNYSERDTIPWKRKRFLTAAEWADGKRALPIAGQKLTMDQAIEFFLCVRLDKDIFAQDRILDTREAIMSRVQKYQAQRQTLQKEVTFN